MSSENQRKITKVEFWGALTGVFAMIFAVHMAATVQYEWFHSYITIFIVMVLVLCLFCFLKEFLFTK